MQYQSDYELYNTDMDSRNNNRDFRYLDSAEYYLHTGHIAKGMLNNDVEIDGWIFKKGTWLQFHSNGRVYYGTLAASKNWYEAHFSVYKIMENHKVFFSRSGELTSGYNFYKGSLNFPYFFSLVEGYVSFRERGKLYSAHISDRNNVSINGKTYSLKPNSHIVVHDIDRHGNSSVKECDFVDSIEYSGFVSDPLYPVRFWDGPNISESGPVLQMQLGRDSIEQGYHILAGNNLQLHRSGSLGMFTLGSDTAIGAIPAKSGDLIWLYESGRLELLKSSEDVTIAGTIYPAGTFIHFDIHGNVTNP